MSATTDSEADAEFKENMRYLRWYFVSTFIDLVGYSLCLPILPFLAIELGASG